MAVTTSEPTDLGDEQPKIIFGRREAQWEPLAEGTILIVPSDDDWNDFAYRTRVDILIRLLGETRTFRVDGFLGFLGAASNRSNGSNRLIELLDESDQLTIVATEAHKYFTMLPSMEAYRRVVQAFGVERAGKALTAMNDLVALNEFRTKSNLADAAAQTSAFSLSFVRNADTYFAYKNAGPILHGSEYEEFGKMSNSLRVEFRLEGRSSEHELHFRFDHDADLPKRIAVVIGKNGVGKSQTLGRIVRAALSGNSSLSDGETGERPLLNRILAFAPTNETDTVFPSHRRKRSSIWYRQFSLNRSRRSSKNNGAADLVIQVARSNESIGESSRWAIFLSALRAIDSWEQICLPVRRPKKDYIPIILLNRGNEMSVLEMYAAVDTRSEPVRVINGIGYPLSSGEISFLKFAAQASLHIENGSLLLLDEPETHLHPNFISQFVSLLDNLLAQTGSAAIIATHSVYFVREVFREQVTVLRADSEGYVHASHPTLRTFGADVGAISYFVFGEDEPSRLAAEVERRLIQRESGWKSIYEKYKDELSLEVLNSLRDAVDAGTRQ
ncbi:AAA family ATPase [Microvirga subterranea]|uniref:Putative AbiEii toxin of type IV toxin-antitoxin system n=1 Tax=Microvirga subterranea TaxID=186651 RepID=A0A370HF26_9HYPH|nr:AAA family ATPase [Microvirga subterranea]RDI53632.1 putative AbiEii toxin of type IV toxin-antitoxin system [Microvirga subterranea]